MKIKYLFLIILSCVLSSNNLESATNLQGFKKLLLPTDPTSIYDKMEEIKTEELRLLLANSTTLRTTKDAQMQEILIMPAGSVKPNTLPDLSQAIIVTIPVDKVKVTKPNHPTT